MTDHTPKDTHRPATRECYWCGLVRESKFLRRTTLAGPAGRRVYECREAVCPAPTRRGAAQMTAKKEGRGMAPTVTLSYEEKIVNALSRVTHKRTDDRLTRDKRDFDAIREVLQPLYRERDKLRQAVEAITNPNCLGCGDMSGHPCACAWAQFRAALA